jgi:nicotinamidase-related amidase
MNPADDPTRPDAARSILLIIDVQADFTLPGAPAEVPGTFAALRRMQSVLHAFRGAVLPVIHIVRLYPADGTGADLCRREAVRAGRRVVRPGDPGAELVEPLAPAGARLDPEVLLRGELQPLGEREWAMYKPRWGAFYRTPLEKTLQRMGVNTVVVCGCNFPNCPRASIYEASERDLRIVFVADAVSGFYDRARQELENIGVRVWAAEECVRWLRESVK